MAPSPRHALQRLTIPTLLIALTTVVYAAPLQNNRVKSFSHQFVDTPTPYGFTTRDRVNQTILLNNGAAENRITYILRLRRYEAITAIIHISTDPAIITANSNTRQQIPHESQNAINFTLLHEFDGRVGVATYNFLVFTNITRYRAMGTYTVAGIVFFSSKERSPDSIASGVNSPGLAFRPLSPENSTDGGTLRLQVEYQPVGPDITGKPPSLKRVLSSASVKVRDIMLGTDSTLITYDDSCSLTRPSTKSMNISQPSMRCGLCFNDSDQSLSITINPERSGTSVVQISVSDIEVNNEIFETDIRVFVKKPPVVKPVVLVQPGTKFLLDYFGTEVIYLQMYNIIQPDQPVNATDFIIDLDMNRYASADISLSRFEQPIQTIAFIVQPPGEENPIILQKIHAALMALKDLELDSPEQSPDVLSTIEPVPATSVRTDQPFLPARFSMDPFSLENTSESGVYGEYPMIRMPQAEISGPSPVEQFQIDSMALHAIHVRIASDKDYYESNAHVIIPPSASLRTAKNVLNNPLLTMFAPNETAVVYSIRQQDHSEQVLISLFLANYSIPTFSEHKSRKIAAALSEAIGNKPDAEMMNGNLTILKANSTGIQVTYAILIPQDADKIAREVHMNRTDIEHQVAKKVWIPPGRLILMNAMVYDPSSPSIVDAVSSPGNVLGGLSGPLLAVIIVLVLVALVPLLALCIGYVTTDPEQTQSSSRIDDGASASFARMPPVLKDSFGRATVEGDQDPYKMDDEMQRHGYYTDSAAPQEQ